MGLQIAVNERANQQSAVTRPAADWSTPKAAIRTYAQALRDGDADRFGRRSTHEIRPSGECSTALRLLWLGRGTFAKAAIARFGPKADKTVLNVFRLDFRNWSVDDMLAELPNARVEIRGDGPRSTWTTPATWNFAEFKGKWKQDLTGIGRGRHGRRK